MGTILTVSQLNQYIASKIRGDARLKTVAIRGEISNLHVHFQSGHLYFSIKDVSSALHAVMYASFAQRLKFLPQNGMNIIAFGKLDVYEKSGEYQIICAELIPDGAGVVHVELEQLKDKLKARGVFDPERKKPIVRFPHKIAVVTSASGAALQDILQILARRFPLCTAEIFPAQVQGEVAASHLARMLQKADASGADTILLARGGGSSEDLMPFNTEEVAMAIYACITPVISAVGHETDTTFADYAADLRAPTPSAAAEQAAPDVKDLYDTLSAYENTLHTLAEKRLSGLQAALEHTVLRLRACSPEQKIHHSAQKIDSLVETLDTAMQRKLASYDQKIAENVRLLQSLSPFAVLGRGYSITLKEGTVVSDSAHLAIGDRVTIRFANSGCAAQITELIGKETAL